MLIALTGSFIISWGDFQISGMALFGNFLALMGAVTITGYFLFGQNVRQRLSLATYTFIVYGFTTVTLLIYNMITRESFTGYSDETWIYFFVLAIIPTFFGHTLFNWALKWVSASTVTMGILFEPIGASVLAYFVLRACYVVSVPWRLHRPIWISLIYIQHDKEKECACHK